MLTGLDWNDLPRLTARDILARLLGVTDARRQLLKVSGKVSSLPFWKEWRLVVLMVDNPKGGEDQVFEDIFCLWRAGEEPLLLDGASDPIHEVNEREGLELQEAHVADYIRFFCFFLTANGEPFIVWEHPPAKVAAKDRKYVALVKPLTFVGRGANDGWQYEGTVVYSNHLFKAVFAVAKNGELEMLDDDPLIGGIPDRVLPTAPSLGYGLRVGAYLTRIAGGPPPGGAVTKKPRAPRARRLSRRRPTIVELVELLLEAALKAQAENRLLTYFNAALPTATELQRFAALFDQASPVIVVETGIPFVEETIAQIVNGLRSPQQGRISVYEADITTDSNGTDAINQFRGLMQGPGIVLLPMQVYPRILLVERLAFEIADKDLAAIIACQKFGDLPEALRRYADIVLKLPPIDEVIFAELFHRVIGKPLPVAWRDGGIEWVKHLLHTDFEHPRRMQLPPTKAFAYIRAQVGDRLLSVDPEQGLGLGDLHGMAEARIWAEDLIADIHAAIAGTVPWSQVDMGALLVGPPGTGKTSLANAIAKGCGIKFIQGSASTWMAEGVSLGPHIAAIRRTFAEARDYAPSILFIDEIDSIGSRERLDGDRNSLYITEVINAVLEQMQGLDAAAPVVVIGATNHENAVDPALRRSGRLDRIIRIPRPNAAALANIYGVRLARLGAPLDPSVDTVALGRLSIGLTGADVERIARGAARRARKSGRAVSQTDLIDEITNKPRDPGSILTLTPADIQRTAHHEAGHALLLFLSASKGSDIGFVSIIPREDGTLGFVAPLSDDRVHATRTDYEEELEVFLAGRAAEELVYGRDGISSGASSDLRGATARVTEMITHLGLPGTGRLMVSDTLSTADRAHAEDTLERAYQRSLKKLKSHRKQFDRLARAIADRQELTGDEARTILAAH